MSNGKPYQQLASKECASCKTGGRALKGQSIDPLATQLDQDWRVVQEHHLEKEYSFRDFRQALSFVNEVGAVAETQGHHPDLYLAWGKVRVIVWTHKVDGLTEADFVLAAKIESLPRPD